MGQYENGINRVTIEGVKPEVDYARFPVKRIIGDTVIVEADIFADGHDVLSAMLLYRRENDSHWNEVPMELLVNDRWRGSFTVDKLGRYKYTLTAWVDRFQSWRQGLAKKVEASQDVSVELLVGAEIIRQAGQHATGRDTNTLQEWADTLSFTQKTQAAKARLALSKKVSVLMYKYADRRFSTTYPKELEVIVDRDKARFSAWYEMFPRSCAAEPGRHGTFKDCEARLAYIAGMGFDVLYLPPIHPIGHSNRKGKNNVTRARQGDPGTPWAIGSEEGGHKAFHPQLGTLEDFREFLAQARKHGIEVALDIAFQCSPDHPYVKEHPEWFRWLPDGTVQYAENPPKKYEDIYPLDFDTENWEELWEELRSVVFFWIEQDIRIFRVDNPHTKPFAFWEWLIGEVKREYPEVIFLAEAFTRPKIMYRLAKLGFSQSYTYFTWRNVKWELTQYFTELTQTDVSEYFRPNLWPNTPDILSDYLRDGGRPAFMARLVLAATLGANYGIYGPAFELCENRRRDTTSEEYLNSEKYEIKHWDLDRKDSLKDFIGRVNRIRHENPALQSNANLWFNTTDNEHLICYSKHTDDFSNLIWVIVNLNPKATEAGWVNIPVKPWGFKPEQPYQAEDLLNGKRYTWRGDWTRVELNPDVCPVRIVRISSVSHPRTRRDFDSQA
jgi:starch synthase (maltosyl-transferring)